MGKKDVKSGESEAVGKNNEVKDELKTYLQREGKAPQYFGVETQPKLMLIIVIKFVVHYRHT